MRRPAIRRVRDWEPSTLPRLPLVVEEDDDEPTLARFVPIPDGDGALDSLVAVYGARVERLKKERAHPAATVAPANAIASAVVTAAPTRSRGEKRTTKQATPLDRTFLKLEPHLWKIVYSAICLWGLAQLALIR